MATFHEHPQRMDAVLRRRGGARVSRASTSLQRLALITLRRTKAPHALAMTRASAGRAPLSKFLAASCGTLKRETAEHLGWWLGRFKWEEVVATP